MGSIAETFTRFGHIGHVLPAMGYGQIQLEELATTIRAAAPDVIVTGTPIDLRHLVHTTVPIRHASYQLVDAGHPTLAEVLAPHLLRWRTSLPS